VRRNGGGRGNPSPSLPVPFPRRRVKRWPRDTPVYPYQALARPRRSPSLSPRPLPRPAREITRESTFGGRLRKQLRNASRPRGRRASRDRSAGVSGETSSRYREPFRVMQASRVQRRDALPVTPANYGLGTSNY
jgi:hypothetical protein